MTDNLHDAENFQKPLFDHPKINYRILAQVILQSEKAGFDAPQVGPLARKGIQAGKADQPFCLELLPYLPQTGYKLVSW